MTMGHCHDIGEGRAGRGVGHIEDAGGLVGDRVLDLPGLGIPDARARIAVRQAHLDDAESCGAHRVVVEIPLAPHHHAFGLEPRRVRKPGHPARIESGDRRRSPDEQAGRGAGGDIAGLGSSDPCDDARCRRLQLPDIHAGLRGLRHRGGHLGPHDAAGQAGRRALGIDQSTDAQVLKHAHGHGPKSLQSSMFSSSGRK